MKVDKGDELIAGTSDAAARKKKKHVKINEDFSSSHKSCKVQWGWQWDFLTFIMNSKKKMFI